MLFRPGLGRFRGGPRARSRHCCYRPLPDRQGLQGVAQRHAPRRSRCHGRSGRPGQSPRARPGRDRRSHARLWHAGRRAGLQPGSRRRRPARPRRPARHDDHPLLRLVPAGDQDGLPRDQGWGRGRVRQRRGRDGQPFRQGQQRLPAGHDEPAFRRVAPANGPARAGGDGRLARPAPPRRDSRRLHRDGPDRREPRRAEGGRAPGAGRVRLPVAEPRREGDRRRLLRARDRSGDVAGWTGGRQ